MTRPLRSDGGARHSRLRLVRAETISYRHMRAEVARNGGRGTPSELPPDRGACKDGPRPCPYVTCKYHLYLDVRDNGSVKLNFPDIEPHELEESCALDAAEQGGMTLMEVADRLNITREAVRLIEDRLLVRIRKKDLIKPID